MRTLVTTLLCLPAILTLMLAQRGAAEEPKPTITVSGNAEVRVVPDQVVLTAAVESRAAGVTQACNDNDQKIGEILTLLKKTGVADQHIHTEYVSIEPIMRPRDRGMGKVSSQQANNIAPRDVDPFGDADQGDLLRLEQPVGYLASRQFAITIVDLEKFERIYRRLTENGINRVRGIEFRTSELRKHRDAARLQAVRAAKEKAQAMAGELGAKLASVKTITESSPAAHGGYALQNSFSESRSPSASSDTFAVGQITIRAAVDVVFTLADAEMDE